MQQWKLKSAIYAPLIMAKTVQQYLTSSKVSLLPPCCIIVDDFNLVMGKNRGLWQHPPATSNYDNSGWAGCQAMARHLGLQDGWGHQHGHDANPIHTHKTLENPILTTAPRIDFVLAPNHPQALLNMPCPRCHINFNFGHDISCCLCWASRQRPSRPCSYYNDN